MILGHEIEDQAVDTAAAQHVDVVGLDVGVAVGVDEQHHEPALAEEVLGAVGHRREERVGDVADQEPDRVGAAGAQALGQEVGLVAELSGGLVDPPTHLLADVGMIAERPRHRRQGDPGAGRDVVHRRSPGDLVVVEGVLAHRRRLTLGEGRSYTCQNQYWKRFGLDRQE